MPRPLRKSRSSSMRRWIDQHRDSVVMGHIQVRASSNAVVAEANIVHNVAEQNVAALAVQRHERRSRRRISARSSEMAPTS